MREQVTRTMHPNTDDKDDIHAMGQRIDNFISDGGKRDYPDGNNKMELCYLCNV